MHQGWIDLGFDILDRHLVDKNGKAFGKVDDLELTIPLEGGPPVVESILTGPGALGYRLPGVFGRLARALWRRAHPKEDPHPVKIPWGCVASLDFQVHLTIAAEDTDVVAVEQWVSEKIIRKIPGA